LIFKSPIANRDKRTRLLNRTLCGRLAPRQPESDKMQKSDDKLRTLQLVPARRVTTAILPAAVKMVFLCMFLHITSR
jgi:hypothetical protein